MGRVRRGLGRWHHGPDLFCGVREAAVRERNIPATMGDHHGWHGCLLSILYFHIIENIEI
jgi:hypothetical protein